MQPIFLHFFSLFKIGDLKTYEVKIPIKPGVDCATDWLFIDFFQTIILNSELKKKD